MAYWSFDEGSGQTAAELVGGVHDGRLGDDAEPAGDAADPVWIAIGGPPTIDDLIEAVKDLDLRRRLEWRLVFARVSL